MNDTIPEPRKPEYLSWDLPRLQSEYFKLSLAHASQQLSHLDDTEKLAKVDRLIAALRDLLEEAE